MWSRWAPHAHGRYPEGFTAVIAPSSTKRRRVPPVPRAQESRLPSQAPAGAGARRPAGHDVFMAAAGVREDAMRLPSAFTGDGEPLDAEDLKAVRHQALEILASGLDSVLL